MSVNCQAVVYIVPILLWLLENCFLSAMLGVIGKALLVFAPVQITAFEEFI